VDVECPRFPRLVHTSVWKVWRANFVSSGKHVRRPVICRNRVHENDLTFGVFHSERQDRLIGRGGVPAVGANLISFDYFQVGAGIDAFNCFIQTHRRSPAIASEWPGRHEANAFVPFSPLSVTSIPVHQRPSTFVVARRHTRCTWLVAAKVALLTKRCRLRARSGGSGNVYPRKS
jgi:hypothetical protein